MEHVHSLIDEIKKQMVTLITAALGFVAALIWKDAITAWLAPLYEDASGAMGLTYAAIVVTIVVVLVTVLITKLFSPKKGEK